ncbi:hypothetical protein [Emticicia agri]|uniref:Uncharacterized protein n=1 Tax=Emticicia agri TaxID=2492393 RepID=A0A4Q5LUB4_9BACT|nr:hypothetical protein [Emticicia agri]RYU93202.1 hypothetical protein EWM59_23290 [Emticicia agri]
MAMIEKVFSVNGNKIASLLVGEEALMFSSQTFDTVAKFQEAWEKKLSLATKLEIKYSHIKSVKKEDNEGSIRINYSGLTGFLGDCEFSFPNSNDYAQFFTYLEREKYFTRHYGTLTSFKAVRNYLIGLVASIAITIIFYYEAIDIANGTAREPSSGKARLFNLILEFIGPIGVLITGGLISCYLVYITWKRFATPPNEVKFLPPR